MFCVPSHRSFCDVNKCAVWCFTEGINVSMMRRAQGDIRKVRTAILLGVAVPLAMFLSWDAAVLGNMGAGVAAAGGAALGPTPCAYSLLGRRNTQHHVMALALTVPTARGLRSEAVMADLLQWKGVTFASMCARASRRCQRPAGGPAQRPGHGGAGGRLQPARHRHQLHRLRARPHRLPVGPAAGASCPVYRLQPCCELQGAACIVPLVVQVHTDSPQAEFVMPYRLPHLSVARGRRSLTSIFRGLLHSCQAVSVRRCHIY